MQEVMDNFNIENPKPIEVEAEQGTFDFPLHDLKVYKVLIFSNM